MSTASPNAVAGQAVDLSSLSAAQLSAVKKQLDDEIEHLSASFQKLRGAQSRFRDCARSVSSLRDGRGESERQILVPLTTSLYVPGRLGEGSNVLVDVGTGYYVEKKADDAISFYTEKVEELDANLTDLDKILQGKAANLRVVEEVLRQKVLSSNGAPAS